MNISRLSLMAALAGLTLAASVAPAAADIIIRDRQHRYPVIIRDRTHRYPVIIRDRLPEQRQVVVEFVAPGQEWANVLIDGRAVFRPRTFNRREQIELEPGAYRLEITGFDRFETWSTGYLDVGRDDSNVIVVTFSRENGVSVSGDPYAWIPDATR
ncbi:MAG: hypothetical protein F6J97_06245 [Leptolyngbya sp. SIO4C1]|nr:hypothetical protein [Leptolyngbya sp. SIO4C1]